MFILSFVTSHVMDNWKMAHRKQKLKRTFSATSKFNFLLRSCSICLSTGWQCCPAFSSPLRSENKSFSTDAVILDIFYAVRMHIIICICIINAYDDGGWWIYSLPSWKYYSWDPKEKTNTKKRKETLKNCWNINRVFVTLTAARTNQEKRQRPKCGRKMTSIKGNIQWCEY